MQRCANAPSRGLLVPPVKGHSEQGLLALRFLPSRAAVKI